MSQVDFSAAPSGATHYWRGFSCVVWYKDITATGYEWRNHDVHNSWQRAAGQPQYPATPIPGRQIDGWNGEGLPPVGTVCEVFNRAMANPEWERCTILFMGSYRAVYESDSCRERVAYVSEDPDVEFRPLRTPEQIAAQEREDAILAIAEVIGHQVGVVTFLTPRETAEKLYDAGYRKQVTP